MSAKHEIIDSIAEEESVSKLLSYAEGCKLRLRNPMSYAHRFFASLANLALSRACELACVPLHQRYAETSNGVAPVWMTYRPEAIPGEPWSWPDALVHVGYVDDMDETTARSRALGW